MPLISAAEALRLPCAQLSPAEAAAADLLEANIDAHIRAHMRRGGVTFDTSEINGPVLAEVTGRARGAGWEVQVLALQEPSPLDPRQQTLIGYKLVLVPRRSG